MARFSFNLEGVLKQRRAVESQRQRELAEAMNAMQKLQDELRLLEQSLGEANDDMRRNHLTGRVDPSWLTAHRRFVLSMQRKAMTLMQRIALVQRTVGERRQALVEASKQTKVLEKLREQKWESWRGEQARKESAELDEAGTQIAQRLLGDDSPSVVDAGIES